jgi:ubiquinone/menaquinone biosynthesis C-methylase UbiE
LKDTYYLDARVAAEYDDEHRGREITEDDVPFYLELAKEAAAAGHSVLELACGTGRVTLPIAEAGVRVTGIDASPAMLEVARQKSGDAGNPAWVEADMTSFELDQRFGLVIIPFRSFLHLLTAENQKGCLRNVHRHLLPGGRLALNFFNPDLVMMAQRLPDKTRTRRLVEQRGDGARREARPHSSAGQTVDHDQAEDRLSDANAVISRVYRNMRLRYVFRHEMEHLLTLCGFKIEALYGWFDRRPLADDSTEMVWIARKVTESDQ